MDDKPSRYEAEHDEQETKRRADAALRVALNTRPKAHSEMKSPDNKLKRRGKDERK